MGRRWVRVEGYQKQASASIAPLATATPIMEIISNTLSTRITHIGTYAGPTGGAWGQLTWMLMANGGGIVPYDAIEDPMGIQGTPMELAFIPELSPGIHFSVMITSADAVNTWSGGVIIRGEKGYYVND